MSSQHYIRVATVREKSGKNENFSRSGKSQRKSLIVSKSVKSQGILFSSSEFISFSSRFLHALIIFSLEKLKSMLQSKQSDQFDTLRLTHVVV